MKGGEIKPDLAARIILYSYCVTFHVSPMEAYKTPAKLLIDLLAIHGEAKKIEAEEIERTMKKV